MPILPRRIRNYLTCDGSDVSGRRLAQQSVQLSFGSSLQFSSAVRSVNLVLYPLVLLSCSFVRLVLWASVTCARLLMISSMLFPFDGRAFAEIR